MTVKHFYSTIVNLPLVARVLIFCPLGFNILCGGGAAFAENSNALRGDEAPTEIEFNLIIDSDPLRDEHYGIDDAHHSLSRSFTETVEQIDAFFGAERLDEEANRSRLRLRAGFEYYDLDGLRLRQRLNLQLDLPRLENRAQLVFTNDYDAEPGDIPLINRNRQDDNAFVSALRFFAIDTDPIKLSFDAGIRWRSGVAPFSQIRARYRTEFGKWVVTPVQLVYYRHNDGGFGETSRLYFDRVVTDSSLFRLRSEVNLNEETEGFEGNQSIAWLCDTDEISGFSIEQYAYAQSKPTSHMTAYETRFLYRRLVHSNWLYAQGGPLLRFRDEDDWKADLGMRFELEVVLGDLSRPLYFWRGS